jgi:hypothetical protein
MIGLVPVAAVGGALQAVPVPEPASVLHLALRLDFDHGKEQ